MKPLHTTALALAAGVAVAFTAATAYADGRRSIKDAPAPFSWTGFYAGLHAGYGFSSQSAAVSGDPGIMTFRIGSDAPSSLSADLNGFLGGVQLGHNWQFGTIIVGIEADISGSAIDDTATRQGAEDRT